MFYEINCKNKIAWFNKLNLNKVLTPYEQSTINILEINYEAMKNKLLNSNLSHIYAIDNEDMKIYYSSSITELGRSIYSKENNKLVNRKTIKRYINTDKQYAGYLWISDINLEEYNKYELIKL